MSTLPQKRVAIFTPHSDPLAHLGSQQAGGQNVYIKFLTRELSKLGWQIDVFTRWDHINKKQLVILDKNLRLIRLKCGKIGYISKSELINLLDEFYQNFLIFTNFENPYSLFHGHYWDGGFVGKLAADQFKKPLVVNFHSLGLIRQETQKKYLKDQNEYEYFVKRLNIENEIIKSSSKIISLAETEKETLIQLYGAPKEKCLVIPGGTDIKQWNIKITKEKAREIIGLPKDIFLLLYVGRLEWRKGIGTLIATVGKLKNEIPNLKLFIVGGKIFGKNKNQDDFKEYERLKNVALKEGVENLIKFVGMIQHSNLPVFYKTADILVIPSYYEPFGLVALEGMAAKVPIIASDVGGLAKIIEDQKTGLLAEPRNVDSLKEKILTLYQNKKLGETLVNNAFEFVKNYSWEKIAKEIEKVYNDLISKIC